jgi:hypothetical protein
MSLLDTIFGGSPLPPKLPPEAPAWRFRRLVVALEQTTCNRCGRSYSSPLGLMAHFKRAARPKTGYRRAERWTTALHLVPQGARAEEAIITTKRTVNGCQGCVAAAPLALPAPPINGAERPIHFSETSTHVHRLPPIPYMG